MKPALLAQTNKVVALALLIATLAVSSVVLGKVGQSLGMNYIVQMLAFTGIWLVYSSMAPISLHGSLILISLVFIKPLEPSLYMILLLLIFLLLAELLQKQELTLEIPYPAAFMLLLSFGIYGAVRIQDPLGYSYFFSTIITPLLALTLCQNARITQDSLLIWMKAVVAIGAFIGAYGIVVAIQNPFARLGSFWLTAMTINGFYTLAFFFALTLFFRSKEQLYKAIYAVAAMLILLGMLYTYTRMAIVAVAFGMFLMMLRIRAMRYVGIILLALVPLIIPSSMVSRIELGFGNDVSLLIRAIVWYLSALQIYHNPLTGMGFGVWTTWYPSMIPVRQLFAQHSHNVFLNVMVEIGIIGALAYFYIIFKSLHSYWKRMISHNDDILHYGVWVSLMALLFACVTDIFIQQHVVSILFWLSLGLVLAQRKEKLT